MSRPETGGRFHLLTGVLLLCGIATAQPVPATSPAASGPATVRNAAVAGLFYPADGNALSNTLDLYLRLAHPDPTQRVRALICPHAGYEYSGMVAATAFKLLAGADIRTAYVLGPSHYAAFEGAYVTPADAYRTPLGTVAVSPVARRLAKLEPFASTTRWRVERPGWASQSPLAAPLPGTDTPETWEHSVEVEIPFVQKAAPSAAIVPIVVGQGAGVPEAIAKAIAQTWDDKSVLVASSDLSHYHPYDEAKALDNRCAAAICSMDFEAMAKQEACGSGPILALMNLAKIKGWKPRFLEYRNSGDTTGDKGRVVGYSAIAFYEPPDANRQQYTHEQRQWLLKLARSAARDAAAKTPTVAPEANSVPEALREVKGCFVTLTVAKDGGLRGCIGHIIPQEPLYKAVIDNARNAAVGDPRFAPVTPDELDKLEVEISVLTVPEPLYFRSPQDLMDRLQPGRDGVIMQIGNHQATYLPQVWEKIPKKEDFLNELAMKAGCGPYTWKTQPTAIFTYQVEAFKESEK